MKGIVHFTRNMRFITVILMIVAFAACSSNEPGAPQHRYDLVTRDWVFESYLLNGNDATDQIHITSIFEEFRRDGVYQYSYIGGSGKSVTNSNPWILSDDEQVIMLNDFVPVSGFSGEIESLRLTEVFILKLNNDKYWYSFEDSVGLHEFHYIAAFENNKY